MLFRSLENNTEEVEKLGQIENSIHLPLDKLRDNLDKLNKDYPVIVYCYSGGRSFNAERILTQAGFEAYNLAGSYALQLLFNQTKKMRSHKNEM